MACWGFPAGNTANYMRLACESKKVHVSDIFINIIMIFWHIVRHSVNFLQKLQAYGNDKHKSLNWYNFNFKTYSLKYSTESFEFNLQTTRCFWEKGGLWVWQERERTKRYDELTRTLRWRESVKREKEHVAVHCNITACLFSCLKPACTKQNKNQENELKSMFAWHSFRTLLG